ncbi:MAG: CDP-alcohol phosphatidyltransferase family protein [Dehalococcoidia bacterium]|jgi:CDP-diacylglycerol--glycerol-3-phosphate 3-phosphatidyltransferase|nr:CDP-alcohol phosphatidyltransferase family protein [Dehalococcoidia bacterium]MDP6227614.1 CDP-alcohol phosphatidyltransferase family protein [Dehalococcoidia bacterium]MDP7199867.1 CDP-alcohol phosphatidyltransferase family protein [Dehalococcoidia bacterium]MDP7510610.1 CDP-alcohol phosphatidyltransferase family protein [Dehalococcoidia bacterium]HJN87490.1 CDP-alcohol phosphatidyltransferase family protein [Dehalococcoidia bacterium]
MAVPGREQFRAAVARYFELPGARFFRALRLTPNAVSLLGFGLAVAAAGLVGFGWLFAGGIVFLSGGLLDALDGALARLTGKASPFGALLDSVLDRLSEAALFVGLAVYALDADFSDDRRLFFIVVLLLALIFSQAVSYLRARGEGLGVFIRSGLMTRAERVVLLGVGLLVGQIVWVLLFIAVASGFTLLQRLFTLRGKLDDSG